MPTSPDVFTSGTGSAMHAIAEMFLAMLQVHHNPINIALHWACLLDHDAFARAPGLKAVGGKQPSAASKTTHWASLHGASAMKGDRNTTEIAPYDRSSRGPHR